VIDALRTSVAARNEADQIRGTAQRLACALKGEQPLRLGAERRHAIFTADPAAVRARFAAEDAASFIEEPVLPAVRVPRKWVSPTLAAAAVAAAAFFVMRLLPGLTMPSPKDPGPVAETEPTGQIMVNPPRTTTGPDKSRVRPPGPSIVGNDGVPPPGKGTDLPRVEDPSSLVQEVPPAVPGPREVIPPPPSGNPPQRPDPRNFDYATPIVPKVRK